MKACGLTLREYQNRLEVLVMLDLVETKVMRFNNITTTHISLHTERLSLPDIPQPHFRDSPKRISGYHPNAFPLTESTSENSTESITSEMTLATVENPMDVKQTLQQFEEKKKLKMKSVTPTGLSSYWLACVALVSDGQFQKPLIMKQTGQLKMLSKILGEKTKPVIEWSVNNWQKFSFEAKANAGLDTSPMTPEIGFLLKYCDTAVNLMEKKDKKLQSIAQPVNVPIASKPSIKEKVKEESDEAEIQALLKEALE